MRPNRVVLLTSGDPDRMTGGYLFHRRMADAAVRYGAQVTFVSIPALPLGWALLSGPWWGLSPALRSADVVVLDSIAAAAAAPWLRTVRAPIVGMLHQPPGGINSGRVARPVRAAFDRWAYRRCRLLMVASDWLAEQLATEGVTRGRLRVVPPGKDPAPGAALGAEAEWVGSRPTQERRVAFRRGRRIAALCIASWLPAKGIIELLDAVAVLPDDLVTLHLVGDVAADRAYARRVRGRLASPGLRSRVVVHGVVSPAAVHELYRSVDVFALPSFVETYGTVWGEAMAAGLAVIGWRAGNLPFLADHDGDALMAPPGDVAALAGLIERVARDDQARERIGRAAAVRAEARPTWDETARAFFAIIEAVRLDGSATAERR